MRQDIRRAHFITVVHSVQLIHGPVPPVTDVEPVRVRVQVVDAQSILFQKCSCQTCGVIFCLFVCCVTAAIHDALNGNGSAVAISAAVGSMPAGQRQRQILPRTGAVHIVVYPHGLHVAVDSCAGVLLCWRSAGGSLDAVSVVNRHAQHLACQLCCGHANAIGVVLCQQILLDGHAAECGCFIRGQNCHVNHPF